MILDPFQCDSLSFARIVILTRMSYVSFIQPLKKDLVS